MRELKPLVLPQLLAQRKSSKSLDMAYSAEPTSSVHSCADSGFYSVSECSTPPTPGHASRGHLRFPSATSSLSSSPPTHDMMDASNASGKLPQLVEEPIEREEDEEDYDMAIADPDRCSCEYDCCDLHRPATQYSDISASWEKVFEQDADVSRLAKRRRSVESSTHSITTKIERRFPSLSKVRNRQRASTLGRSSRSTTPSRVPSRTASHHEEPLRSSSITSSVHQMQGFDLMEKFPPSTARSSKERLVESIASSPIDIAKANAFDAGGEDEESRRFATTPLLPPLLVKTRFNDVPTESPLQSPTVATTNQSLAATPIGTPPFRAYPTPPLSSKPSIASFKNSRTAHLVPASDIPELRLGDPNDKWANILSHSNFTIHPVPYVPEVCDKASVQQLFADWEQARCNFTKHQVRTAEHHGATSKTYVLTEQKWAEVDALWKANHDLAVSRATAAGEEPEPLSPVEPAPLSKMPTLNDPKSEGKFPKLGDEDIVGPMVQIASQIQKTPSRKRAFFKFFSDMKFPGSFLGRSSAGIRSRQ